MKTPEEVADNFFDGGGRKQDLVGVIRARDREVGVATLREAARFFENPAHSPGATLTVGNAARALRDMADAIPEYP